MPLWQAEAHLRALIVFVVVVISLVSIHLAVYSISDVRSAADCEPCACRVDESARG